MFELLPSLAHLYIFLCITNFHALGQLTASDIPPEILPRRNNSPDRPSIRSCDRACSKISSQLHHAVFTGQTGDNFDFWDAKKREVIPACRVEPSDNHEVSLILKTLTSYDCHFAVKSGGHERGIPGLEMHANGVIIDLVRMKNMEVSDDGYSVTIGPGWRWGDLYKVLEEEDAMVLGGRLGEVGVGGLLLGGGISFHSNWRGLACDAILAYEMVLPNATITLVDQKTYPELYRALRGGAAMNFGIITSFVLEAFSPRSLWYGRKAFDWDSLPQLLEANHHITTQAMDEHPHVAVMNIFMCYMEYHTCFGNIAAFHAAHNSTTSWPVPFDVYEDIGKYPQTSQARTGTMSNITGSMENPGSIRHRTIYATFTYTPSIELEQLLLTIFREEALHPSLTEVTAWLPGMIMHPFSRTMLTHTRSRDGNAFSMVADHEGPLTVLNIAWQWDEKVDDAIVYESYYRTMARLEETAKEMGLWHPYKYINYAEASQDVFAHLSTVEMQQLSTLQREIDPSGVFAEGGLARGPFKVIKMGDSPSPSYTTINPSTGLYKDEL